MRTLLLTPGPLTTSDATRAALGQDWGSRDPGFIALTARLRERLRALARGEASHETVLIAGSGTFAVEAAIGTLVPRDGRLLVLANGAYGQRMATIARRIGRDTACESWPETEPVDPARVLAMLQADAGITDVALVHCETTTGMLNPLEAVAEVVAARGRRLLVDAMSSLGALPIDLRRTQASAVLASSNKCLEGVPGIGVVIAERGHLASCAGQSHSLSLDLHAQWAGFEANGQWRFTPPVQVAAALDAALDQLDAEGGAPARLARYRRNHAVLTDGMKALGYTATLRPQLQAPIIVTFDEPAGFDFARFYDDLQSHGIVIYPGKLTEAPSFRIGCIGAIDERDIARAVACIGQGHVTFVHPDGADAMTGTTEIAGSHLAAPAQAQHLGAVPSDQRIEISIYLRPRDQHQTQQTALTGSIDQRRQQLAQARATAHQDDFRRVTDYLSEHGLSVVSVDPARRLIRAAGVPACMESAFGATLALYEENGHTYRARSGTLAVPQDLHGLVESVLGIDGRPVAHTRIVRPRAAQPASVEPSQMGKLYDFPTSVTGAGVTIALIELGGGFRSADTKAAFKAMGLKTPRVIAVSVDGGVNDQSGSDADGEVALDIQVAGGVAPGAEIAVYFAPNTDAGFADAISQAAHDATHKPSIISISWGGAETGWQPQAVTTMNTVMQEAGALGISVFVASGDNLATDSVSDGTAHVDFPASSPYAIGCGGTHITFSGTRISQEVVWNDGTSGTGGGISDLFPVPGFQANANLPASVNGGRRGRGVPDVAGNAAPASGYVVVVDGQSEVVGGTSAVAPLWAGLTALISQKASHPVGFLPDFLYASIASNAGLLTQITQGNNKPEGSKLGYDAGPGWNACTGLGRPNGQALFAALTEAEIA